MPVDITGDDARRAAHEELSDPIYHQDDPSPVERGVSWLLERLGTLLGRAGEASPGGYVGLIIIVLLVLLAIVAIRLAVGGVQRTGSVREPLFAGTDHDAADHRAAADEHAARGEWAEAIRERLRAIVRDLEERGLLEPRPGRTADEVAAEAGAILPGCADGLREAAQLFDRVWYGRVVATAEMNATLRAVDDRARAARPARNAGSRA